jgi:hypothetical protein
VRPQDRVLRNQRPVEIDRERSDVSRKARREFEQRYGVPPVDFTTNDATSAIC